MRIDLPHVLPTKYLSREIAPIPQESEFEYDLSTSTNQRPTININSSSQSSQQLDSEKNIFMTEETDDLQCADGNTSPEWKPINWNDEKNRKKKICMNVEFGLIFLATELFLLC